MPNIKSAIKRVKTNNERNAQNAAVKSSMRTAVKKAEAAATNNEDNAKELVNEAVKSIRQSSTKRIYPQKCCGSSKSRLMKKAN